MTRRADAIAQLRDRLQEYAGETGSYRRDGSPLASGILIVRVDVRRLVRRDEETTIESDDRAFLISFADLNENPLPGDEINIDSTEYRVTERREFESCWRWHDSEETQRLVFAKLWG